jgi:hypothetical protein
MWKVLPGFRYAAFAFLFFSALNFAHRNFVALKSSLWQPQTVDSHRGVDSYWTVDNPT